jgi:hypothetical protein
LWQSQTRHATVIFELIGPVRLLLDVVSQCLYNDQSKSIPDSTTEKRVENPVKP